MYSNLEELLRDAYPNQGYYGARVGILAGCTELLGCYSFNLMCSVEIFDLLSGELLEGM